MEINVSGSVVHMLMPVILDKLHNCGIPVIRGEEVKSILVWLRHLIRLDIILSTFS